ncbi:MAG: glycine cleavage system protein H [Acidimicrobiales bacterium]|jgi:glycine cleavage system H protein
MGEASLVVVAGFTLALDRRYQPETHMWVLETGPGRVRIGMDSLGVETSGTLAQLSFFATGTELTAGRPFGQLEAAKFVGPLISPVSGAVLSVNEEVASDPGLAERDPYGAGWLIEAATRETGVELPRLLAEPAEITAWFSARIAHYRLNGLIAQ